MTTVLASSTFWVLLVGVLVLVPAIVVLRTHPRLAVAAWFVVLATVPIWVSVPKVSLTPQAAVGIVVILALAPYRDRLSRWDLVMGALIVVSLLASLATYTPVDVPVDVIGIWTIGYVTGRFMTAAVGPDFVYRSASIVLGVAGGLAVVEYLTRSDPFQRIVVHNALYDYWGGPNSRSGEWRAEGAFGHPIALGASLAIAVPWCLGSSLRVRTKVLVLAGLFGGAVVTFSRIGLICGGVGLLASLVSRRTSLTVRARVWLLAVAAAASAVLVPFFLATVDSSGAVAADSADYRGWLLQLVPGVSGIGMSPLYHPYPDGTVRFGDFASIDNALLLIGLRYGWTSVVVIVVALLVAAVSVLRLRGTPATVALVAQIPAFVSAALITQYAVLVWVVVGVAVTAQAVQRPREAPTTMPPERVAERRGDEVFDDAVTVSMVGGRQMGSGNRT